MYDIGNSVIWLYLFFAFLITETKDPTKEVAKAQKTNRFSNFKLEPNKS